MKCYALIYRISFSIIWEVGRQMVVSGDKLGQELVILVMGTWRFITHLCLLLYVFEIFHNKMS